MGILTYRVVDVMQLARGHRDDAVDGSEVPLR